MILTGLPCPGRWKLGLKLPVIFLMVFTLGGLLAGQSTSDDSTGQAPLRIDPLMDTVIGVSGITAFALSEFLVPAMDPAEPLSGTIPASQLETVSDFDRLFMAPYNGTADTLSTIAMALSCLTPALVPCYDNSGWLETGLIAAESLAWTRAVANTLKQANPRLRPWTMQDGYQAESDQLAEADQSWPSGHTALAFAGAATTATLALARHPHDPATPWVVAGSLGIACLTAGLRVASGEHFASDVLSAAAIGSVIGTLNALLHVPNLFGDSGQNRPAGTY